MGSVPQQSSALTDAACAAFATATLPLVARIPDWTQATDLAVALSPARLAVVRCISHIAAQDQSALATMVSQGDFVWGAVVYNQGVAPSFSGPIESFHVSQLDQLVARLEELREAWGEAGSIPASPDDQSAVT